MTKVIKPAYVNLSELAQAELEDRLGQCTPEPTYNEDNLPLITTVEQAEALASFVCWANYYGELYKAEAKVYVKQVIRALETENLSMLEELKQFWYSL